MDLPSKGGQHFEFEHMLVLILLKWALRRLCDTKHTIPFPTLKGLIIIKILLLVSSHLLCEVFFLVFLFGAKVYLNQDSLFFLPRF